jgi:phosphatidylglycerol lysyltransferase
MVLRRLPFTSLVTLVMMVAAVATGALWSSAEARAWYPSVAYGLPSMEHGSWWTLLSGPFFAVVPLYYLPMAGGFALLVGFAEWRLGTRRTMAVTLVGQLVSVLAATVFLALFRDIGWDWADEVALTRDVGASGGALAAIAVVSAAVRPPWRLRIRAALVVYVGVSIIYIGTFADLVHFIAVALALPLAGRLAGEHRGLPMGRPAKREWRLLAVTGLLLVSVAQAVMWYLPGDGPFGSSGDLTTPSAGVALLVVVVALIINGLRRGSRTAWRWAVGLTAFVVAQGLLLFALLAFLDFVGESAAADGVPLFVADSLLWTAELVLLIAANGAFRSRRFRPAAQFDPESARNLLRRNGGGTLSWMTTWAGNSYFRASDAESYLAYRRHAGVAIALGDAVTPLGGAARAVREYADMCDSNGLVPCLFSVTAETTVITRGMGWRHVQVAEDTVVGLNGLEFRGKAWQDVRSSMNRARKEGIEFRLVTLAEQPRAVVDQVRAISEEWLGDKGMPEMGFTLGGIDEALDPATRVGLAVDAEGTVHGVTSWMPVHGASGRVEGWTLDLMRRRTGGFRPVMEFLIASSCLAFQGEGADFVSLSGAPLAKSQESGHAPAIEQVLASLGAMMEPYYGFRSLHAFKAKFKPRHEPLYLAYRDEADLPRIGLALGRAYLPDTGLVALIRCAKSRKHADTEPARPKRVLAGVGQ